MKVICPQCRGHGYPPATLWGFRKVDGEVCPTCQSDGEIEMELPNLTIPMTYQCRICQRRVPATSTICPKCLSSQLGGPE